MVLNKLNGFVHQLLQLGNGWLDSGGKAAVLAGLFFLPLSLTAAWISFFLAASIWLGRMLWQGEVVIRRTGLDLWLAGFVFLAALSVWQSDHTAEIWYNYCYLVGLYVLAYCMVVQTMQGTKGFEQVAAALLASSVAVCLIGLFQYVVGVDVIAQRWIDSEQFPELKTRVFSTLGNPNVLAAFLVMTAGLSLGWSSDIHRRDGKLALLLVAALSIVCILLTYSRGAWLALGVMGLLLLLSGRRPGRRSLLLGMVAIGVLAFLAHESLLPRFRSILGMFNPADSSVALRWALWESTLAMVNEHPWLGLGWGSYRFIYPEYDFFVQNPDVIIYHGHNTLLSLAAEVGLPGTMLFAIAWAVVSLQSLRRGWQRCSLTDRGLCFGFFLAFSGMAAFSLTDHVLFNIQVTAVFWSMMGAVASANRQVAAQTDRFWLNKKFRGIAGFF
jgi:putative inorganic carbon (HCO3(-)) transporter